MEIHTTNIGQIINIHFPVRKKSVTWKEHDLWSRVMQVNAACHAIIIFNVISPHFGHLPESFSADDGKIKNSMTY